MTGPCQENAPGYTPLFHICRGTTVESIHYGAIAVVTAEGNLFAWAGDPHINTFLRSSAKPFQTLPLLEMGGLEKFQITGDELAITCASHSGTDTHLKSIYNLQQKIGVSESDLRCCTHQPFDPASREKLRAQGIRPSPNHHNCSGKHTGMLGQAKLLGVSLEKYTEVEHPVQEQILSTFCEMCEISQDKVSVGRDGCSVPTFSIPLFNSAWGWARLVNPAGLPDKRTKACQTITNSMGTHPFYIGGPGRFDTQLMKTAPGKIISKTGAEAFQAAGIFKNAIAPGSPALGIALKIADGDQGKRSRRAVMLEVLNQLNLLSPKEQSDLGEFGPVLEYRNQCGIVIGQGNPCFQLQYS